ncbi:MAG: hypothetical protein ACRD9L_07570 [Bryobacteraceae bacterium]
MNQLGIWDDWNGMLHVFFDPAETVQRADRTLFWVWPFLLASAAGIATELRLAPIALRVLQTNPPLGFSADDLQPILDVVGQILWAGAFLSPILLAVKLFGIACVIVWTCKLMKIPVKLLAVFNLVAACSLIRAIEDIASYSLVRARMGGLHSLGQLQASFCLDALLPHAWSPVLMATLNFFSIFEIWYLAILVLGVSYLARCSTGRAFGAITLVWAPSFAFAVLSALV